MQDSHRLIRFAWQGQVVPGVLVGGEVHRLEGWPGGTPVPGERLARLEEGRLLAPCVPSKIIAVGLNYAAHAAETGKEIPQEPLFFLKPPSSVIGPGEAIVLTPLSQRVDYEVELAVVIGRRAKDISVEEAASAVLGYTCGLDITARDLQRRDGQWTRSKSFDTFCPLGPWIVPGLDPHDLLVECRVNGEVRQHARTSDLIFGPEDLVARASQIMTLEPGDVILTGTPAGIGPLRPGDRVEAEIEGIGVLENPVVG